MAQQDEIILDVKVNTDEVRLKMSAALGAVNDYKAAQKELNDTIKQQGYATKEQAASLARIAKGLEENQRAVKSNMAILQAETMARVSSSSSLDDQRQALNAAQKAYAQLSGEAKIAADTEGGLRDQIKALSDSVKAQEAALGDARRNVGSYSEAITAAIPAVGTLNRSIQTLNKVTSLTPDALKDMASGIKSATQAALKFIATPLGATIAAIAVVLKLLTDVFGRLSAAIKKNDDASTALARLYAQTIQPIVDATTKAFAKMAEWVGKAADAMANWLGGTTEAGDAAEQLVKDADALEDAERAYAENSARRNKEIAEDRAKAADKEKYTFEERKQFLKDAQDAEAKNLEENKKVLAERLRILEETAKREQDTSDETKNKIVAARVAMLQAETDYNNGMRKMQKEMTALDKEKDAERRKAVEDAKKAAAVRLEIERSLQDALIALDTDAVSRQVNTLKVAGEREVENLRIKLNNLKKTDKKGRDDLQKLIVAKEQETQRAIDAVLLDASMKRAEALRKNAYTEQQLLTSDSLQLAQFRQAQAQQELTQLLSLTQEQQQLLYSSREEYDAAVLAADKKLADETLEVQAETYRREQLAEENEYNRKLNNIQEGDAVALAEAELAQAQSENEQLVNMDAATKNMLYKSQEDYEAAVIASEKRVTDAKKKAVDEQRKMAMANAQAIAGAMGALSGLLDEFGEENEAMAKASKVLALGKIAVETGVAIASGVAQAQSVPFPANIAAIATTVATVLANIATAVSTVKSAKFATGGIVGGTSYTGDQVPARLNSGEMVLNRESQTRLFDALSSGNDQQLGFNYELMAAANAALPAPVTVLKELREAEDKVSQFDEIASI